MKILIRTERRRCRDCQTTDNYLASNEFGIVSLWCMYIRTKSPMQAILTIPAEVSIRSLSL